MDETMEFALRLANNPKALSTVTVFAEDVLKHLPSGEDVLQGLVRLIEVVVVDAIEHAYPKGDSGDILVTLRYDAAHLTIIVRDYGLPQDVDRLEAELHDGAVRRKRLLGLEWWNLADELHWISYGPEGKALQLRRCLHETHITEHLDEGDLKPFVREAPHAPPQEYEIRRMHEDEAVQVSQLIYRGYGASYFNHDVYYPERIASLNRQGVILSFVAVGESGDVVGHYALEKNEEGPVREGGQAVVDPAHRGRKLMDGLKAAAIEEARRLNLFGIFGDAVTVHTFSQKLNISLGADLACANLGISPKTEIFLGLEHPAQAQRVSCLLYFLWLTQPVERTIFAPPRHAEAIAKIYANLQCPVNYGEPASASGHGELTIRFEAATGSAFLQVSVIGEDTVAAIRHAKRELIEKSHAEAIFVDLPLDQAATPATATALEAEGFWFAGVTPHFSPSGDRLRLIYLTEDLRYEEIHIVEPFGEWLVQYALADRQRLEARVN